MGTSLGRQAMRGHWRPCTPATRPLLPFGRLALSAQSEIPAEPLLHPASILASMNPDPAPVPAPGQVEAPQR